MSDIMADQDVVGEKINFAHEEVIQHPQLTLEELTIERKLRRRIDCLVMPLVILVYMLNYIDRYVSPLTRLHILQC
jgi:hypothetical protein